MAKPYLDGKGWAIRMRIKGQQIYLSGFATEAAAKKAAAEKRRALDSVGKPSGFGPWRTSVAQALQNYALERLPSLKGGQQDAARINRYLRYLNLDLIKARKIDLGHLDSGKSPFCTVELVPCPETRTVPKGLHAHREKQQRNSQGSDKLRAVLARTMMSDVTPHQVQLLLSTMDSEGCSASTISLERSILRVLFNHARQIWSWPEPMFNPATGLKLPPIDNKRERVISNDEWDRICSALKLAKNRYVAPALALLLATTMRVSEALFTAHWADVDMEQCILKLRVGKGGWREVPLSPDAMAVLRELLSRMGTPDPAARILPITYDTVKSAWTKACIRAGVDDANIHDLRHTGATRYAIEYQGNMYVLKIITGHKTDSQLSRYVNIKPRDVARMMHGRSLDEGDAPAGLTAEKLAELFGEEELPDNVVRIGSRRRAA